LRSPHPCARGRRVGVGLPTNAAGWLDRAGSLLGLRGRRVGATGLFPVHEQEPAWRVELRLTRGRRNLELQFVDQVLGSNPQQSSAKSPSRRVRDKSIACTWALSVTSVSFRYRCATAQSATIAPDRRDERRVKPRYCRDSRAEDHAAETRVMGDILRLDAVHDQLPPRAILRRELGDAIHRIPCGAFVPCRELERARNPSHVVGVGSVLDLRLEPRLLRAELLDDIGRAIGEWERPGEDLDHGATLVTSIACTADPSLAVWLMAAYGTVHVRVAVPAMSLRIRAGRPSMCAVHAEHLVGVSTNRAVHLVGSCLEGQASVRRLRRAG